MICVLRVLKNGCIFVESLSLDKLFVILNI